MNELLTAEEAISLVKKCEREGIRILGVDGFVEVPAGFEAKLDLILDVSQEEKGMNEAANEVLEFISRHARQDVRFELCIDEGLPRDATTT